jgi:ribose 1,5-bisphosphate isomerase
MVAGRRERAFPAVVPGARNLMDEEIPLIAQRVIELHADHEHGASWLARAAATALRELAAMEELAPERRVVQLRRAGRALAGARPSMAALLATVSQVLAPLAAGEVKDASAAVAAIRQAADEVLASWDVAAAAIAEHARPLLGERVLTHSASATVLQTLQACRDQLAEVIVTEARPGCEGRETAARLAAAGIPVTLITDAQAGLFLPGCRALVLGADSVLGSGAVVNKVGSALFAQAARAAGVPCYALCETFKIAPVARCAAIHLEEMAPTEVLADPPPGVTPRNVYFDCVPASLVTAVITERGLLPRAAIAVRAREVRWRARRLGLISSSPGS